MKSSHLGSFIPIVAVARLHHAALSLGCTTLLLGCTTLSLGCSRLAMDV
jgi:hypothetical protein